MLVPDAGDARLRSDLTKPPQQPTLSRELARTGAVFWGLYKICVAASGNVAKVGVVQGAAPLTPAQPAVATADQLARLDQIWMTAIRTWRYEPHRVVGSPVPVPFCYVRRLQNRPPARMLAPDVGAGLLLTDLAKDPHAPRIPADSNIIATWGVYQICAELDGSVYQVKVIKSADPSLDARWTDQMKTWRYRPHLVAGAPSRFCYPHYLKADR